MINLHFISTIGQNTPPNPVPNRRALFRLLPLLLCLAAAPPLPDATELVDTVVTKDNSPEALLLKHSQSADPVLRAIALQGLLNASGEAWIAPALYDKEAWVRRAAARTIAQSSALLSASVPFLNSLHDPYAQLPIVHALTQSGHSVPRLSPVKHASWDNGVYALLQHLSGDTLALKPLVRAISSGALPYEPGLFLSLAQLKEPKILAALVIGQTRAEPEIASLYVGARLALGDKRALKSIHTQLSSDDREVKLGLLEEISRFGPQATRHIARRLKRDHSLRPFALLALEDRRAVFKTQPTPELQRAALYALRSLVSQKKISSAVAEPRFEGALRSTDIASREAAVLGLIASRPVKQALVRAALNDDDDAVSLHAAAYLLLSAEAHP